MLSTLECARSKAINTARNIVFSAANIHLKGIDISRPGQIVVSLFLENGFPKDASEAIKSLRVFPSQNEMLIPIEVPSKTEFAVKVHHDENMDGKVTKDWTDILPGEGLSFSGGASILRGVPAFRVPDRGSVNPSPLGDG